MSLRLYDTRLRRKVPFEPLVPGKVGMYACGITVYDLCHVGHARMLVAWDVIARYLRASGLTRSPTSVTSPTSTTRSSARPTPRAWPRTEIAERYTTPHARGHARRSGSRPPTTSRAPPSTSPRWSTSRAASRRRASRITRAATSTITSRASPVLRHALGPAHRRSQGGRAHRGRRAQEEPARLRAVEGREARRAVVGEPVGRGPPGLAHRVLGDGAPVPRRAVRHPRRRRRPHLPAPHERDRAVGGRLRRGPVRAPLDPLGHGELRRREDVEVARQRRQHPQGAGDERPRGAAAALREQPLPQPRRLHDRQGRQGRRRSSPTSTTRRRGSSTSTACSSGSTRPASRPCPRPRRWPRARSCRPRTARWRRSARPWTTTSTRRPPWATSTTRSCSPTSCSTSRSRRPRTYAGARSRGCGATSPRAARRWASSAARPPSSCSRAAGVSAVRLGIDAGLGRGPDRRARRGARRQGLRARGRDPQGAQGRARRADGHAGRHDLARGVRVTRADASQRPSPLPVADCRGGLAVSLRGVDSIAQLFADLEESEPLRLHVHRLARARVAPLVLAVRADREAAEATNFDAFALLERVDHAVEHLPHEQLGATTRQLRSFGDDVDEIGLGHLGREPLYSHCPWKATFTEVTAAGPRRGPRRAENGVRPQPRTVAPPR